MCCEVPILGVGSVAAAMEASVRPPDRSKGAFAIAKTTAPPCVANKC